MKKARKSQKPKAYFNQSAGVDLKTYFDPLGYTSNFTSRKLGTPFIQNNARSSKYKLLDPQVYIKSYDIYNISLTYIYL